MSETKQEQPEVENAPLAAMQAFATLRGRPAVFLVLYEPLDMAHLFRLRDALGDRQFEDVDLVIDSAGGDISVAYQMVELLRLHTERVFACVPFYAKSAATLLCLGADVIFLDKMAQLGPLDAQVQDRSKAEFTSALNPFKALEQAHLFSLDALDTSVRMIAGSSGLDLKESIRHAINFVVGTTGPLFSQLDPEKLGEYSRALAEGSEYGNRLLRRFTDWDDRKRAFVVDKLVHGYPSHKYVIDYHELEELGFKVQLFEGEECDTIQTALNAVVRIAKENEQFKALVHLAEPVKQTRKPRGKEPKEEAP